MSNESRIIRNPEAQAGCYTMQELGLNGEDGVSLGRIHFTGTLLQFRAEDESLANPPLASAQVGLLLLPRLALSANVASRAGLQTLQGVLLVDADIVLLTAQNTASQNGPWQVHANDSDGNATPWTRPKLPIHSGQLAEAQAGTNAGLLYRLVTQGTIVLDTTALTYDTLLTSTSALASGNIADGAVTTGKLADGAVTGVKIAAAAFRSFSALGLNGAGAVTLTGAKVGDTVQEVLNFTDGVVAGGSFEPAITVADQIQQSDAGNLSAKKFAFRLKVNS